MSTGPFTRSAVCSRLLRDCADVIAVISLVACTAWSTSVHGQAGCPAGDFDRNYNCPAGPVYVTPGWGNVPWLRPANFKTIQTGDLDGDGADDLIGRDATGLRVFMFDAALGAWRPVLTLQGGDELVLRDLSDANSWDAPQYYETIKLVRLEATPAMKLVARSPSGLLVYQFTRGPDTSFGFPTGSWKQVTTFGPFKDKDSDTEPWDQAPYYQTLRYGTIDATGAAAVVGWGTQGLYTFLWNGSGWTQLAFTPAFGDAAGHPGAVISSQLAKIDTTAADKLLVMYEDGLAVFRFVGGTGWQGIFSHYGNTYCDPSTLSCEYTLQTATLDRSGFPVIIYKSSINCSPGQDGVVGLQLDSTGQLNSVFDAGPFTDCAPNDFHDSKNFRSIRAADIDGDGIDELIGRGPKGILAYSWNSASQRWSLIVNNVPTLSDALWAGDPSYWGTIRTAKIEGRKAALLARGPAGMRTWVYNGSTFARPKPYGNFPALDATSYKAINNFLNLPSGVRASYTDGTNTSVLSGYKDALVGICKNEISGDPPQFESCAFSPPAKPGPPVPIVSTTTVNQLLRELFYAISANGYFDTVSSGQNALFSQEGLEFPSIEDNLLLAEASKQSAAMNYLNLFANMLKFAGSLLGVPEITVAANAVSAGLSVNPLFQKSQTATLQQQYAGIQGTISSLADQASTDTLSAKTYVAGDYALLATVGQLVGSDVWKFDKDGYLSLSRYAFTVWVMQQLLPTVWETYQVFGCDQNNTYVQCLPPPNGPNMASYTDYKQGYGIDFTGILEKSLDDDDPCAGSLGGQTVCEWTTPPQGLQDFVFLPLPAKCIYSPGAGTGWVYPGTLNSKGCTLGAAPDIFRNVNGWNFESRFCPLNVTGDCDDPISAAP